MYASAIDGASNEVFHFFPSRFPALYRPGLGLRGPGARTGSRRCSNWRHCHRISGNIWSGLVPDKENLPETQDTILVLRKIWRRTRPRTGRRRTRLRNRTRIQDPQSPTRPLHRISRILIETNHDLCLALANYNCFRRVVFFVKPDEGCNSSNQQFQKCFRRNQIDRS